MICPNVMCDSDLVTVIQIMGNIFSTKRGYKCDKCGSTWNTYEKIDMSSFVKGVINTKEEKK